MALIKCNECGHEVSDKAIFHFREKDKDLY